jgi:hypothetical protein
MALELLHGREVEPSQPHLLVYRITIFGSQQTHISAYSIDEAGKRKHSCAADMSYCGLVMLQTSSIQGVAK